MLETYSANEFKFVLLFIDLWNVPINDVGFITL